MDYFIWKALFEDGYCVCRSLEGFEDAHKLKRGTPVAGYFPDDALFRMDSDFPKDIKLADNVRNGGGFILVSKALKVIIEQNNENNVEYLPIKIINHKGRVASNDYFVINPLDIRDAIDLDRSKIVWNNINPEIISSCKKLVLKEEKIPPNFKIFRIKYFYRRVLLSYDLVELIKRSGFSGIALVDVKDFKGF